jgi:hypothetical protein
MKILNTILSKIYWLAVASIPLLLWYLFGTFRAPRECVDNATCMQFYSPLDGVCTATVLLACILLWPLCMWRVFKKMG